MSAAEKLCEKCMQPAHPGGGCVAAKLWAFVNKAQLLSKLSPEHREMFVDVAVEVDMLEGECKRYRYTHDRTIAQLRRELRVPDLTFGRWLASLFGRRS